MVLTKPDAQAVVLFVINIILPSELLKQFLFFVFVLCYNGIDLFKFRWVMPFVKGPQSFFERARRTILWNRYRALFAIDTYFSFLLLSSSLLCALGACKCMYPK